jgi:hypothetical protein
MCKKRLARVAVAIALTVAAPFGLGGQTFALNSTAGLKLSGVKAEAVTYMGRKSVQLLPSGQGGGIAILDGTEFGDGTIEMDLAGKPAAGAPGDARGFVGVAFRVAPGGEKYECFYLRPTNGRADDQERRNHSAQYVSLPDYEWFRLRKETPSRYESYVDLVTGEWTKVKIEVKGVKARLYVHAAAQPTLIVNDLKMGEAKGAVALWIGVGAEGYFSNLRLSR